MAAVAVIIAATLSVVAWHMRRPNFRDLRVSTLRFLPDLHQTQASRTRITFTAPLRSRPFWLRVLACAALVAAVLPPAETEIETRASSIGLRVIIDTSASMQVADDAPGPTRLDSAKAIASEVLRDLLASGSDRVACVEILAVGATRTSLGGGDPGTLTRATQQRTGASVLNLVSALDGPSDRTDCALSHALVFSDQTMPAELPEDLKLIWHQVGEPRPNLAITGARRAGRGLLDDRQGIEVLITVYGDTEAMPSLDVIGPDGPVRVQIESDPLAENRMIAYFDATTAGRYRAKLPGGDAFDLDDRIAFFVSAEPPLRVDWQATVGARPSWLPATERSSEANLRVLDVAFLSTPEADAIGPAIFLFDGFLDRTAPGTIGPFMSGHRLLDGVNFDVFEEVPPGPIPEVPPEVLRTFESVIQGERAPQPWVAARENPRQVILPMPPATAGDGDAARIGWIMFANALRWMDEAQPNAITPVWQDAEGRSVLGAFLESGTARPLAEAPLYDGFLDDGGDLATTSMPVWPWLLALAALLLGLERLMGLVWRPAVAAQ